MSLPLWITVTFTAKENLEVLKLFMIYLDDVKI